MQFVIEHGGEVLPVMDNHLHLDPENGKGLSALMILSVPVGTHMIILNKPSWELGVCATTGQDFQPVFETTMQTVAAANKRLPGKAWGILGIHPGLISRLVNDRGFEPTEAATLMKAGAQGAADYVSGSKALGLKSGRPHYEVTDMVWEASNDVMKESFRLGAQHDCVVQLHTEATKDLQKVANWAKARGLDIERVIKHYAEGTLRGPTPSVMSDRDRLSTAASTQTPFLMETDFIDDPDRPGAVLGPKTVPRRVRWLLEQGHIEAVRRAHVSTPAAVYDIDTRATLVD